MVSIRSVWYWFLPFLPFISTLTLILTLIICIVTPNNAPSHKLPQISELGTGEAHIFFAIGFSLLLLQILPIIIGRLQYLIESQNCIRTWLLCVIHVIPLVSGIFMMIMAIVSVDNNLNLHLVGAYGMFSLISLYVFIHTLLVFILWVFRSSTPKHANIFYLIYYLSCTVLLIIFFITWLITELAIPEYIAAAAPFFYFIGFVPQFWARRRGEENEHILSVTSSTSNETSRE